MHVQAPMFGVGVPCLCHAAGVSADQAVPPSGVVTFLFTDVEGSTRRWENDADAMRVALAAHDALLRKAIEANGGWVFKHTGDGVCAVFASPRSAVDAAVAAQRALELPVRMGIATGEAERLSRTPPRCKRCRRLRHGRPGAMPCTAASRATGGTAAAPI